MAESYRRLMNMFKEMNGIMAYRQCEIYEMHFLLFPSIMRLIRLSDSDKNYMHVPVVRRIQ